jgi:hypothetical protein
MNKFKKYNQEQFITHDTALLAKKVGFSWPTYNFWYLSTNNKESYLSKGVDYDSDSPIKWDWNNNSGNGIASPYPNKEEKKQCSAPTQEVLHKWIRETYNYVICVRPQYEEGLLSYDYYITTKQGNDDEVFIHIFEYDTYEEAMEKALVDALYMTCAVEE